MANKNQSARYTQLPLVREINTTIFTEPKNNLHLLNAWHGWSIDATVYVWILFTVHCSDCTVQYVYLEHKPLHLRTVASARSHRDRLGFHADIQIIFEFAWTPLSVPDSFVLRATSNSSRETNLQSIFSPLVLHVYMLHRFIPHWCIRFFCYRM